MPTSTLPEPREWPCAFKGCEELPPFTKHNLLELHTRLWHADLFVVAGTAISDAYPCMCAPRYGGRCKGWKGCPCAQQGAHKSTDHLPDTCCARPRKRKR